MVPVAQRPRHQDLIAAIVSTGELTATGPTVSRRTRKDICSSASAAAATAPTVMGASEDPGSAVKPPSCTALVAVDSAAAPVKLQQRLHRRWRKKWMKCYKRQDRKQKLKRVEDELRKVFQEHQATATVGELRAMVGHAVGVPLDAQLKKHRPKRRFTIARGSRTESA